MNIPIVYGYIGYWAEGGKSLGDVKATLLLHYSLSNNYPSQYVYKQVEMPIIMHRYIGKLTGVLDEKYSKMAEASTVTGNISLPSDIWEELIAQCVVEEL